MIKIIRMLTSFFALFGVILICVNLYVWYKTGEWGAVSAFDILSYISGRDIEMPGAGSDSLHKWTTD